MNEKQIAEVAERLHNAGNRFQGFTDPDHNADSMRHYVRDLSLPPGNQVVWRGSDHADMMAHIRFLELRAALAPFRKD